ncbi:MAG: hypothetical protein HY753_01260 [Nitrospirae bacterium]|nr:hypothetical protein [Nitrospirota bacterium]
MARWKEDSPVEHPTIEIFQSLGYYYLNGVYENFGEKGIYGGEIEEENINIELES